MFDRLLVVADWHLPIGGVSGFIGGRHAQLVMKNLACSLRTGGVRTSPSEVAYDREFELTIRR